MEHFLSRRFNEKQFSLQYFQRMNFSTSSDRDFLPVAYENGEEIKSRGKKEIYVKSRSPFDQCIERSDYLCQTVAAGSFY